MDLATANHTNETRAALPKIASVTRMICRRKSERLFKIPYARTTEKLNIKAMLEVKVGDERLLFWDNKKPGKDRILILGTKKNLKRYRRCRLISCDATYKVIFLYVALQAFRSHHVLFRSYGQSTAVSRMFLCLLFSFCAVISTSHFLKKFYELCQRWRRIKLSLVTSIWLKSTP